MTPTISEMISGAQSCAISIAFLYLVFQARPLLGTWAAHKKELTEILALERARDQDKRHEAANKFSEIISQMFFRDEARTEKIVTAIHDLRVASEHFCRANRKEVQE